MKKEKKEKKITVVKKALELQSKKDEKINPIDLQREIHKGSNSKKSYIEKVQDCVKEGCKEREGDFYIVCLIKKERHLQNIIRPYIFHRKSCPSPDFDQTVYKFHRKDFKLEYLWCIPDRNTYINIILYKNVLPLEQNELIEHVLNFKSGKLDQLCAKLNGEKVGKDGFLKNIIVDKKNIAHT